MTRQAATFLPAAFHENLDAATLLTDEIVLQSLRVATDHAHQQSLVAPLDPAACYHSASLIYQKAAETLRAVKDGGHGPNYARDTETVLARVRIADDLTTRAGEPFDLASRFGHLHTPLRQSLHTVTAPRATRPE